MKNMLIHGLNAKDHYNEKNIYRKTSDIFIGWTNGNYGLLHVSNNCEIIERGEWFLKAMQEENHKDIYATELQKFFYDHNIMGNKDYGTNLLCAFYYLAVNGSACFKNCKLFGVVTDDEKKQLNICAVDVDIVSDEEASEYLQAAWCKAR